MLIRTCILPNIQSITIVLIKVFLLRCDISVSKSLIFFFQGLIGVCVCVCLFAIFLNSVNTPRNESFYINKLSATYFPVSLIIHTHKHMHINTHTRTHTTYTHKHTHTRTHTHTHTHTQKHTRRQVHFEKGSSAMHVHRWDKRMGLIISKELHTHVYKRPA